MNLPLQDFPTLVRNMAAGVQGAASALVDLTVGSVLRAMLEANASVALWIQWLIVQLLATTRAATSTGPDLDSWVGDYSLSRLPAAPATGQVTFSRFTTGLTAYIPAGTLVRTADGSQSFTVQADATNPAWVAAQSAFVVGAATGSITLTVQAVTPGSAGNVLAGSVTQIAAAIPGIDTVSNNAAFQNGMDPESDAALRVRFQGWTASLARATPLAVQQAVASVQQNLTSTIAEGVDTTGNPMVGNFVLTVDDGSGAPPASLLATVTTAVEAVRPVGITYAVQPPVQVPVAVALTITVASSADKTQIVGPVAGAISTWINALPIGAPLPISRIATLAYGASASVTNVTAVTLNGGTADVVPAANGVVKASGVAVN